MSARRAEIEERFALEYLQDLNATAAYQRVKPNVKETTARVEGCRLLANPNVQHLLQVHRQRILQRLQVSAERVIAELAAIGFSDLLNDYQVDEFGYVRLTNTAHSTASRAIGSIKRKVRTGGTEDRSWTEYETEIRLWPKVEALTKLAQHLGLLKDPETSAGGCEIVLGADESVRLIVRGRR